VMDYFYNSPFYEKNSINHICKIHNQQFNVQKLKMSGIEFNLEFHSKEKDLYYISKSYREKNKLTLISYYYVFKGTIYQSPDLYSLVLSNMESLTNNFVNLVKEINEN
jgi:hypothetical protein